MKPAKYISGSDDAQMFIAHVRETSEAVLEEITWLKQDARNGVLKNHNRSAS